MIRTNFVVGCWAWGNKRTWDYGTRFTDSDIATTLQLLGRSQPVWLDTAEIYSAGRSESIVGKIRSASDHSLRVSTKIFPFPWRLTRYQFDRSITGSLRRLQADRIDLLQIHHDPRPSETDRWFGYLAEAVENGKVLEVGLSNSTLSSLQESVPKLKRLGLQVASLQVKYNLCHRKAELDGTLAFCQENGIQLLAHSALGHGLLSGSYLPARGPSGPRGRALSDEVLAQTEPVRVALREVGHQLSVGPIVVALAWIRSKGAIPIVGVHSAHHAADLTRLNDFTLPKYFVEILDELTSVWVRH